MTDALNWVKIYLGEIYLCTHWNSPMQHNWHHQHNNNIEQKGARNEKQPPEKLMKSKSGWKRTFVHYVYDDYYERTRKNSLNALLFMIVGT